MLLCFFVFSLFVMMNSFAVVVCRRLVMPGCIVVVLAGSMFHQHWMRPFDKKGANDRRSSIQEDLQKTLATLLTFKNVSLQVPPY
jgi:hypothetical protein